MVYLFKTVLQFTCLDTIMAKIMNKGKEKSW